MDDMLVSKYGGCGKRLLGSRRLSRKSDKTNSPEKQADQSLYAAESVGGHIIGWADDWEVSGTTDPMTRPKLGPWLRGEMGPYDGIVGSAVDRIGRNVVDVLNTGFLMMRSGKMLVTYGHQGPWNLDDENDENRFMAEAWGAQMEHRAIRRRNRDETVAARKAHRPRQKSSYGYMYVRLIPTGGVDHIAIDPEAAKIIREVARRILTDETGLITVKSEAKRLTLAGVPSPADHRLMRYGKERKGTAWSGRAIWEILNNQAAMGYQTHQGKPVLDAKGHPVVWAPPLWDRVTHTELVKKTAPQVRKPRAPRGDHLLLSLAFCGACGRRLYIVQCKNWYGYACTGRRDGIPSSQHCQPAPTMMTHLLERIAEEEFLREFGRIGLFHQEYDPGNGAALRRAELQADRERLREDRKAGLYQSSDDTEWFRREYARMGEELEALREVKDREPGMYYVDDKRTVADQWRETTDIGLRRELLATHDIKVALHAGKKKGPRAQRVWVGGADADLLYEMRKADAEFRELWSEHGEEIERMQAERAEAEDEYQRAAADQYIPDPEEIEHANRGRLVNAAHYDPDDDAYDGPDGRDLE